MLFRPIKSFLLLFVLCLYAPMINAAEDVDWASSKDPLYATGSDSSGGSIIGTRWAFGARKDDVQITFSLEASTDMKKGGWIGDIRVPEKFYVTLYLIDSAGNKQYFKVDNARAVGPDTKNGGWKEGPATAKLQMMMFDMSWDKILRVKKANKMVINYSPFDNRDDIKDIIIPLDNFGARLGELEASIKSVDGGPKFVMTKAEIDTTPVIDLPAIIRAQMQDDLQKVSGQISLPMDALMKLSMQDIQKLMKDRAQAIKDARLSKIRKAHQAIYNQEPKWLDMNVCPKPDVNFCNNVGKFAYEDDDMFSGLTHEYGEIIGVVWRSTNSIVRIYGGSVDLNLDPKISRASTARYYYIVKNDRGQIDIRPCESINAKG